MGDRRPYVLPRLASVVAGILFVLGGAARPAHGAEPDDPATAAARAHAERATRFYQVGAYREALDEYRAAHLAKPDPALLFNVAQCLRQLGDTAEALKVYRRFVALAPDSPARPQAEKHIREIEAGGRTTTTPALGSSSAVSPGPAPATLARSSPVAGNLSATTNSSTASSAHGRWLPWLGAGLTVALASGAVAAGLSANSRYDHLHDTCGLVSSGCPEAAIDRVKSRAHLATALWIGAGVAAAATGIMLYLGRDEGGVSVAGHF